MTIDTKKIVWTALTIYINLKCLCRLWAYVKMYTAFNSSFMVPIYFLCIKKLQFLQNKILVMMEDSFYNIQVLPLHRLQQMMIIIKRLTLIN